jgi:serralysin
MRRTSLDYGTFPANRPRLLAIGTRYLFSIGIACIAMVGTSAHSDEYFIGSRTDARQSASNGNSGTSRSKQLQTLQQANTVLRPGDSLTILDGTYDVTNTPFEITASGTPDAPIIIRSAGSSRPRIVSNSSATSAISVNAAYVNIQGIDASSGSSSLAPAIMIYDSHHITVSGSDAHDSGGGGIIAARSDYVSVIGNSVYRNAYANPNQGSGISIGYGVNYDRKAGVHNIIASNTSYSNRNKVPTAAGYTTDGKGIVIDRMNTYGTFYGSTVIKNNTVYSNGGSGIAAWLSDNVVIQNNTVSRNFADPLHVKTNKGEILVGRSNDCQVYSNRVTVSDSGAYAILNSLSNGTEISNNTVAGGRRPPIYSYRSGNVSIDSNNIQ